MGKVKFLSHDTNLRLVRRGAVDAVDASGRWFLKEPEVSYQFATGPGGLGQLEVEDGQDVLPDGPGGAERDATAWLRAHPLNGVPGWFYEMGREPDPSDVSVLVGEIAVAAAAGDIGRLREIEHAERTGYSRKDVLMVAEAAIRTLEQKAPSGDVYASDGQDGESAAGESDGDADGPTGRRLRLRGRRGSVGG